MTKKEEMKVLKKTADAYGTVSEEIPEEVLEEFLKKNYLKKKFLKK